MFRVAKWRFGPSELERRTVFLWILCDCILSQIFPGIPNISDAYVPDTIKNYGMVHICIFISYILLVQHW